MKYLVTILYDASETIEVDAEDLDSAVEMAHSLSSASVCNHCSKHLDLGDAYDECVSDEAGNILKDAK